MGKLSIINILVFFLSSSCAPNNSINTQNTKHSNMPNSSTNSKTSVAITDTNPPANLLSTIAINYEKAGWLKSIETLTAAIPAATPNPPQIMSSAQKTINTLKRTISVVFGDITKENVDAIVNAANSSLQGGGGVDGAIHKAAAINGDDGQALKDESKAYKIFHNLSSFPIGSAMLTKSYGLAPKIFYIIHTVGPQGASTAQKDLELYSAVYNSIKKADEHKLSSISIPAISTGIFGFPLAIASGLFFKAALQFFADNPTTSVVNIRFTNFDQKTVQELAKSFSSIF